jgi:hypothetical protein
MTLEQPAKKMAASAAEEEDRKEERRHYAPGPSILSVIYDTVRCDQPRQLVSSGS